MIRTIIIDDERHCIDELSGLLAQHFPEVALLGSYETIDDGEAAIKKHQPDLVFLDVQVKDKTGFDLLERFSKIDFSVIFQTAYNVYAVRAFEFSALDYLLKPITEDALRRSVEKISEKISMETASRKYEALLHNIRNIGVSKRICIPFGDGGVDVIQVSDIMHCDADNNYTDLCLRNGAIRKSTSNLKKFEEMLEPYNFFRIHNSCLINLTYVKNYNKMKGVVTLEKTEKIVSDRKRNSFLARLSEL